MLERQQGLLSLTVSELQPVAEVQLTHMKAAKKGDYKTH